MEINQLTHLMEAFVDEQGWYADNSQRPQTPRSIAISLLLESAEVLEHFQWSEGISSKEALASELADVMLYLLQLAAITSIDLEEAVISKLTINKTRSWDNTESLPKS